MKNKNLLIGVVLLVLGVFIIYWAQTHAPNASIGSKISNKLAGSYNMGETSYYLSLIVGGIAAVFGALKTYKAVK